MVIYLFYLMIFIIIVAACQTDINCGVGVTVNHIRWCTVNYEPFWASWLVCEGQLFEKIKFLFLKRIIFVTKHDFWCLYNILPNKIPLGAPDLQCICLVQCTYTTCKCISIWWMTYHELVCIFKLPISHGDQHWLHFICA